MEESSPIALRRVAPDTEGLLAFAPVPGFGVLAVNAYLIRAAQPVLVDTGLIALREPFMERLREAIPLSDLAWLYLTHVDPDHIGSIAQVLAEAPNARVITTYVGMAKMNLHGLPIDRVYLLNPGQRIDVGDRQLLAVRPPTFDAPETTAAYDTKTGNLFSADCYGALLGEPAPAAEDVPAEALREGLRTWTTVDAPWLPMVDGVKFAASLDTFRRLEPKVVLSAHLPPATGMMDALSEYLTATLSAPAFVGPDQAAPERAMAAGGQQ
ncbi:MAG: MBL fold metallo-hydrolase [Chloroflexi bacterium]|nr:MBL fold metallo-hydrolase [Chloroflexota bacterium]